MTPPSTALGTSVWVDERAALGGRYVTQSKIWSTPLPNTEASLGFSVSDDGLVWLQGRGRIMALDHRSSILYQIFYHNQ